MNKHFRYTVFLSLFFAWDSDLYREYFDSNYNDKDRTSPMQEVQSLMGTKEAVRAYNYADELRANPPKVVE